MSPEAVRFESVRPRDVELLVCEEASISEPFRSWLFERSGLAGIGSATPIRVRDAVEDRESDDPAPNRDPIGVELALEGDGGRHLVVLVAAFDGSAAPVPRSVRERLRTRRERALEGDRESYRTVLLAPETALEAVTDGESPFDAGLSLESLRDRLAARGTERGDFRARLVTAALEDGAGRRTGEATDQADARRSSLVRRYRSIAAERAPSLEIDPVTDGESSAPDSIADPTATAVAIDAPSLAADHRLVHDLDGGTVDLRIPGAADRLRTFVARHASALSTATTPIADDDALVLRRSVPAIDSAGRPDDDGALDGDAFDDALEAIRDLLEVSELVRDGGA